MIVDTIFKRACGRNRPPPITKKLNGIGRTWKMFCFNHPIIIKIQLIFKLIPHAPDTLLPVNVARRPMLPLRKLRSALGGPTGALVNGVGVAIRPAALPHTIGAIMREWIG